MDWININDKWPEKYNESIVKSVLYIGNTNFGIYTLNVYAK